MSTIIFVTAGESGSFLTNLSPLTTSGREQAIALRNIFYPEGIDALWERFDLALTEPTQASRETAIIILRKQVPSPVWLSLPALSSLDSQTEADIAALYRQLGNAPLRDWVDVNTGEIQGLGAWIHRAGSVIQNAITAHRARHTLVIGQAVLLAGIALGWTNDADSFPLLLDTVFVGGEGFRLDSETGAVALIQR